MGAVLGPPLLGVAVACSGLVEGGRPFDLRMTADPLRAAAGDTVTFTVEATGTNLIVVALEFGDGQRDSLAAFGATRGTLRSRHAYEVAGSYLARATALDVSALGPEELRDSVRVEITPR